MNRVRQKSMHSYWTGYVLLEHPQGDEIPPTPFAKGGDGRLTSPMMTKISHLFPLRMLKFGMIMAKL